MSYYYELSSWFPCDYPGNTIELGRVGRLTGFGSDPWHLGCVGTTGPPVMDSSVEGEHHGLLVRAGAGALFTRTHVGAAALVLGCVDHCRLLLLVFGI